MYELRSVIICPRRFSSAFIKIGSRHHPTSPTKKRIPNLPHALPPLARPVFRPTSQKRRIPSVKSASSHALATSLRHRCPPLHVPLPQPSRDIMAPELYATATAGPWPVVSHSALGRGPRASTITLGPDTIAKVDSFSVPSHSAGAESSSLVLVN